MHVRIEGDDASCMSIRVESMHARDVNVGVVGMGVGMGMGVGVGMSWTPVVRGARV